MKTIIYTRLSAPSKSKGDNNEYYITNISLDNQYKNCKQFCIKNNIDLLCASTINEIGSAWYKNNKQDKLKKFISSSKNSNIIINSVCRFSRHIETALEMLRIAKNNNITIYFVEENLNTDNPDHIILIKRKILDAEEEVTAISRRVKLHHKYKKKEKDNQGKKKSNTAKSKTARNILKKTILQDFSDDDEFEEDEQEEHTTMMEEHYPSVDESNEITNNKKNNNFNKLKIAEKLDNLLLLLNSSESKKYFMKNNKYNDDIISIINSLFGAQAHKLIKMQKLNNKRYKKENLYYKLILDLLNHFKILKNTTTINKFKQLIKTINY